MRDLSLAGEVHETLRKSIIEGVRTSLAATARDKLRVAHQLYDDALARPGQTSASVYAMHTARQAETVAAAELAAALGVTPSRSLASEPRARGRHRRRPVATIGAVRPEIGNPT